MWYIGGLDLQATFKHSTAFTFQEFPFFDKPVAKKNLQKW
jgi:hypothetical protein